MSTDPNQITEQAAASGVHIPQATPPASVVEAAPAQPESAPIPEPFGGAVPSSAPLADEIEAEKEDASPEGIIRRRLAQRRAMLAQKRDPLYLEVPGYEDLGLEVEYHFVTPERLGRNGHKLAKITNQVVQNIAASKATLVECCEQFHISINGERIPLSTSGVPAKYDRQLVDELGGDPRSIKSAADAVSWLFENDYAIVQHAKEVNDWLAQSNVDTKNEGAGFELDFDGA